MDSDYVLVTTAHRGVFFGKPKSIDLDAKRAVLTDARNCIYWSAETNGFLGLAATGPAAGSKIGPAVEDLTLTDVTSVTKCTPGAVDRWRKS